MGKKIVLTGTTLTDIDAPMLATIDPIESAGSLLLIEPMHPAGNWSAGVPANGATIPNLLKATLTTGDASFITNGGLTSTKGKLERSTKGGLHGIVSQSSLLTNVDGARVLFGSALRAYVFAHLTNDYYISVWDRLTRANGTVASYSLDYSTSASVSQGIGHSNPNGWNGGGSPFSGSRTLANTVGARFGNVGTTIATMSQSTSMDGAGHPEWGSPASTYNAAVFASRNDKWTSFCFYRVYMEDLTVSGRTYAEVDAIDHALYTKHVLTAGGRYYGDTMPTAPSTIP